MNKSQATLATVGLALLFIGLTVLVWVFLAHQNKPKVQPPVVETNHNWGKWSLPDGISLRQSRKCGDVSCQYVHEKTDREAGKYFYPCLSNACHQIGPWTNAQYSTRQYRLCSTCNQVMQVSDVSNIGEHIAEPRAER